MSLYDYKPGEYPETIYLVPTDLDGPVWETEPAPGDGMDPDDAVRYVRADLVEDGKKEGPMAVSEDKMREAFGRLEEVAQMADSQCYMNQEDVADFILAVEAMSDALTQQPESEPVYVVVAGGIGPGEEFVEIENAQGESVGVPHSMDGDYRRSGPLYTGPQPTPQVPEGWRVEDEPEHSMITVHSPNGKAAILRDFDGSVGGMFLHFIRDLTAAPSIAEEREPKKSEGLHRNLYEMANQLIVKVGADGEICAKEKEFEQLYNAVLELEDAGPFRPEPPDGGEQ